MTQLRVLTRGKAGPKALTQALDELGIQNGEEFCLVRWDPRILTDDEFVAQLKRDFGGKEE